jgi:uncharacterized protein (UPF0335 family)
MSNMVDSGQLRSFLERIEKLETEKRAIAEDIGEVYKEIKSNGFDAKVIRAIVAMRKQDKAKREEFEAILELYLSSLGELSGTPLGVAAVEREFGARNG